MKVVMNESVKEIALETQLSKKSGNEYTTINVEFANGYVFKAFLTAEQKFIIRSLKGKEVE